MGDDKYLEWCVVIASGEVRRRSSGGVDGLSVENGGEKEREKSFGRLRPQGKIESIVVLKFKMSPSSVDHSGQEDTLLMRAVQKSSVVTL